MGVQLVEPDLRWRSRSLAQVLPLRPAVRVKPSRQRPHSLSVITSSPSWRMTTLVAVALIRSRVRWQLDLLPARLGASVSSQTGLNDPGAASAGVAARCVAHPVTTAIPSGTVVNIAWTGTVVVRALALMKVSSAAITGYRTNSGATGGNTVANGTATALVTPSVNNGEGVLCWAGHENGAAITGDADTTNGTWSAVYGTFTGSAAAGQAAYFQSKVVTATATQSFSPTGTSSDWITGCLIFTETINTPPTVALNSPAAAASVVTDRPTLDFTGTDAENDDVRYNVQIAQATLIESFDEGGWTWGYDVGAINVSRMGQSFTGVDGGLTSCKWRLENTGFPTGPCQAALYAHAGTFGDSSVGTGTALATSNPVDISTGPVGAPGLVTFTFPTPYTLVAGTKYVLAFEYSGGDGANFTNILAKATDPAGMGNASYYYSGAWTPLGSEVLGFYVYAYTTAMIDKVSGTDAGFVNPDVGGDTDPFTSGHNIQYAVQAGDALALGDYGWRVRGIDPVGFNAYGAWTSYRTFTVLPPPTPVRSEYRMQSVSQSVQRSSVM